MENGLLDELRERIYQKTALLAGVEATELNEQSTLDSLGLDSADAVILAMEVEEATGSEIDVGIFLRFSTIAEAAAEIVRLVSSQRG